MTAKTKSKSSVVASCNLDTLLENLSALIVEGGKQAMRAVKDVQMRTCWEVGRHIVEFEQGGGEQAEYGAELISEQRMIEDVVKPEKGKR